MNINIWVMNIIISEILQSDSVHFSVQQYKSYISVSPNLPSRQGRSGHTQLMVTIVEKAIIVRILMAILHFFKRPPLSNGLYSQTSKPELYVVYYMYSYVHSTMF